MTLNEIRDKLRKKVEALGLPAGTISETRDILEGLDAVSEELQRLRAQAAERDKEFNVLTVRGAKQAVKIGLLQAKVNELEEIKARHVLNAIKRICPDCGDNMCGDNHDVCYKCKLNTLRKAAHQVLMCSAINLENQEPADIDAVNALEAALGADAVFDPENEQAK